MKHKLIALAFLFAFFGMTACVNDVEEEIIPSAGGGGSSGGGSNGGGSGTTCNTDNVTFSGTVNPLITTNCLPCHSASRRSGGISLEGYESVKASAQSGDLLGVITHATGYSPMPRGATKLANCDIESIKKWIDDGTPQN